MRKALIIGSEGQDGTLLKFLLRQKGYSIYGLGLNIVNALVDLDYYMQMDLSVDDFSILEEFIKAEKPDEIYYLAAFHNSSQESISGDFKFIKKAININYSAFIKVLELCRVFIPKVRIIYSSSSLIFSGTDQLIQDESTRIEPRCIYSITKAAAMEAAKYYRGEFNMFVSIGIMYNHESSLRNDKFLSKKIINQTRQWLNKEIDFIKIGDLSAATDWGYAPDYVEALWHILQLSKSDTFIVSSNNAHKVEDWFDVLFSHLRLNWRNVVIEDKSILKRNKPVLIGNNQKLLSTGWSPRVSFKEMVIKIYYNII
jgi:GDPmannose 4,6-dehydratase